jgi:hypothetical protein
MLLCNISALAQGVTIVSLPKFDPVMFLEALQRFKVSYAPLVPPIINFLARHPMVRARLGGPGALSLNPALFELNDPLSPPRGD